MPKNKKSIKKTTPSKKRTPKKSTHKKPIPKKKEQTREEIMEKMSILENRVKRKLARENGLSVQKVVPEPQECEHEEVSSSAIQPSAYCSPPCMESTWVPTNLGGGYWQDAMFSRQPLWVD